MQHTQATVENIHTNPVLRLDIAKVFNELLTSIKPVRQSRVHQVEQDHRDAVQPVPACFEQIGKCVGGKRRIGRCNLASRFHGEERNFLGTAVCADPEVVRLQAFCRSSILISRPRLFEPGVSWIE